MTKNVLKDTNMLKRERYWSIQSPSYYQLLVFCSNRALLSINHFY